MRVATALLALVLAACGAAPAGRQAPDAGVAALGGARYQNPVLAEDFADPAVLRAADGRYYAYATQARGHNVGCLRSDDMVHWQPLPDALPGKPAWAHGTQNFWAPHVVQRDGRYLLYFAAQADGGEFSMGLGVATADRPEGPFRPEKKPIVVEPGFSAIDAFVMADPASGKPYMVWGSGFKPLRARELRPDGLAFAPGAKVHELLAPRDKPFEHLIEGSWIHRHGKYFYLWYSGDNCCTDEPGVGEPTYAAMVARSTSFLGPYERHENGEGEAEPILHRNDRWLAPGHNAVVQDGRGTDWIVFHAVDATQRTTPGTKDLRRCLLIDRLSYVDGWPHVAGDSPSTAARPAPAP